MRSSRENLLKTVATQKRIKKPSEFDNSQNISI